MAFPRESRCVPRPRAGPSEARPEGGRTGFAAGSSCGRRAGATPPPGSARPLSFVAAAVLALAACTPYVQGNGVYLEEDRSRDVGPFFGLHVEDGIEATVTSGAGASVVVSGDANVVKYIVTEVRTDTVRSDQIPVLHVFVDVPGGDFAPTIPLRAVVKLPVLRYVSAIEDSKTTVSDAAASSLVVVADATEVILRGPGGDRLYPTLHDATLRAGGYPVDYAEVTLTGRSRAELHAHVAVTGEAHDTSVVDNTLGSAGTCSVSAFDTAEVLCN